MSIQSDSTDLDDLIDDLIETHTNNEILDSEELDQLVSSYEKAQIDKAKHREICRNYYNRHYTITSETSPARNAIIIENQALRKLYYQRYYQERKNKKKLNKEK